MPGERVAGPVERVAAYVYVVRTLAVQAIRGKGTKAWLTFGKRLQNCTAQKNN